MHEVPPPSWVPSEHLSDKEHHSFIHPAHIVYCVLDLEAKTVIKMDKIHLIELLIQLIELLV